jgi:hypothetical protein
VTDEQHAALEDRKSAACFGIDMQPATQAV